MQLRIGHGIDLHQFQTGRPLYLGGVLIPSDRGLIGHSDADALLHALIDAILGAVGRGDIGHQFPDSDPKWKDVRSTELLKTIWCDVSAEGWMLVNADCTVITELPKISPHIESMKGCIAEILECTEQQIGIKATTAETLGTLGRGEGLLASSVVLLQRED